MDSNKFIENTALDINGETAYFSNNRQCYFSNNILFPHPTIDSSSLYLIGTDIIIILNSYFDGKNYQIKSNSGGAIYAINFINLFINNSKIINFKAMTGGGIRIESTNVLLKSNAILKQNYINNNQALSNGGGIYILNIITITFDSNTFDGNSAINPFLSANQFQKVLMITGGAIYYNCMTNFNCVMTFINNNKIINNFSSSSGGGISWITLEPIFYAPNYNPSTNSSQIILFNNNTVNVYLLRQFFTEMTFLEKCLGQYQYQKKFIINSLIIHRILDRLKKVSLKNI